jgi:hypothetical protein
VESEGRLSYLSPDRGDFETVPRVALSPVEAEIMHVVTGHAPITAKAIASRIHRPYDCGLRMIQSNFCERRPPVLRSGHDGYRFATESVAKSADNEPHTIAYHEPYTNGRFNS